MAALAHAARFALDFALPPRCPGCGTIVDMDHRFCTPCWETLRFLGEPCCANCGIPIELDEGAGAQCGACIAEPPPWKSARAALAYGDVSGQVAIRLKYGRRTGFARLMATYMLPHIVAPMRENADMALIVPVPLHRWRLWHRGFNQSLLIARHLGKDLGIAVDPFVLKRSKATRPLRDLAPKERERAVRGAFAIERRFADRIAGKQILLVDDIHTSGATARACTRILLRGGAASVHLICWARALREAPDD